MANHRMALIAIAAGALAAIASGASGASGDAWADRNADLPLVPGGEPATSVAGSATDIAGSAADRATWRSMGDVNSVAISGDGMVAIAVGDGQVWLWPDGFAPDRDQSGIRARILAAGSEPTSSVAFDDTGKLLAAGSQNGDIRLWDTATSRLLHVLRGHSGAVRAVAFGAPRTLLASAGDDGTVRLWDARTGSQKALLPTRAHPS